MDQELLKEINNLAGILNKPCKVLLTSHYNPDGDAIGSIMALYHYLKKKDHKISLLVPNDFPDFLSWMKDADQIVVFCKQQKKAVEIINNADVILCVDFNDVTRLRDIGSILAASKAVKVLIDHHPKPDNIFDFKIVDINVSASAELVYKYIVSTGDRQMIDNVVAECIYAGIMTDTGCFSFNSSNPETFNIVADLLTCGISKDRIYSLVYDNFSHDRMKLLGYCLDKKMVVLPKLHAAYIYLTKDEMLEYNFKPGDSEGFVNFPFSIAGIHITALFSERKGYIRISMRSRGGFAVNEFCAKHFEGGGHKNAAGGESKLSLGETIKKFEKLLELYQNEIESLQWFGN